jgi:L-amino acid N-acyltransferase YncA
MGFQQVGRLVEVGYKFGQRLDVVYLQLMLIKDAG